jgi:N-acetyl-D-muramate 6-phosphate phosphatase
MNANLTHSSHHTPAAVLFDFDGTLADTAPDMAFAANMLRKARGMDTLPISAYRSHVSRGARGMIGVAFGKTPDDAEFAALKDEFLSTYEQRLCVHTTLFAGIEAVLRECEQRGIPWGIVTNKATRYARPILRQLGLDIRTPCIVCGDTTLHAKPHPAPLLAAAALLNVSPAACWYVGDDERDIIAAHAAGMRGIVATYGYLGDSNPDSWGGDDWIDHPEELLDKLTSPHTVTVR